MESLLEKYDPFNPLAEEQAFQAGINLNNPPENFDTPFADGTVPRKIAEDVYTSYVEARKEKGLPLFPTKSGKTKEAENLRKAYSGLDSLQNNLRPDQWDAIQASAKDEADPQEYAARVINANYLRSRIGQDIPPEHLTPLRDAFAQQELGLTGDITDKAVYQALQKRFEEDDNASKAITEQMTNITGRMLSTIGTKSVATSDANGYVPPQDTYSPPTIVEREAFVKTLPARHQAAAREQWNTGTRELSRLFRKFEPLVKSLDAAVQESKMAVDPEKDIRLKLDQITDMLPDDKKERGVVLAMLSNTLANNPEMQSTYAKRFFSGIQRSLNYAVEGIQQNIQKQGNAYGLDKVGPVKEAFSKDAMEFVSRRRELLSVIQGSGMDLHAATDNFLQDMGTAQAQSLWMIPAAFHPAGWFAIQQSMSGDSYQGMRLKDSNIDPGIAANLSEISGMAQAVEEVVTDRLGVALFRGKLPTFTGFLNKFGVANPLGRAALQGVAAEGLTTGTEFGEEITQGATDLAISALAQDLSGITPEVDWLNYFKGWTTDPTPEAKETFLACLGFGLVAGAGASFNQFKYGSALAQNKAFLQAHGFTESETRDITNTTDVEEVSKKFRAAFMEAQQRGKNLTPEQQDRLAIARKEAIEVLKARNEAAAAAGVPVITKETNSFTDETEWVFNDELNGTQSRHATEEEALQAWNDWSRSTEDQQLETVREAAHGDFIDFLTGDGQAAQNVNTEVTGKTLTVAQSKADTQAELKAATDDLAKAQNPSQQRQAEERIRKAQGYLSALKARLEVLIYDRGSIGAAAEEFDKLTIRARNFSTSVMGRIAGYTVQLFGGHTMADITEDFAEVNMKQAFDQGLEDPEILLDNLRRYEATTGARLVDPSYTYNPENITPIAEGFSKLARGVVLSEVNSGLLPPTVAKWIKVQIAIDAASVELARDLATAGEYREALQQGYVPPRLHQRLLDSVGLDPSATMRRLEKEHEAQLAAEAMQGFPEISEEAAGRIPHPETLRAEGHPLAGEVRRLWESMKKSTKRRTKDGKTVDRTNEANAYFLPIGQMEDLDRVREYLNQRGFEFETITDMLDALDASISYGKPFYGTGSQNDETFAIGTEEKDGPYQRTDTSFAIGREVAPTDYKQTAHQVIATTNVSSLTKSLLAPGESLFPLSDGSNMLVSPAYKAAKKGGDKAAAWKIALSFTEGKRLDTYAKELIGKKLVFVPVQQAEGDMLNMLPLAFAHALNRRLGGRVERNIIQHKRGGNTGVGQDERSSAIQNYRGTIELAADDTLVLVDDTFTTGSTLTALYDHLAKAGHQADYIVTIATGRYTKEIAATPETQSKALDKIGLSAATFEREIGQPINTFTGAELRAYLLNGAAGIDGFRKRFIGGTSSQSASVFRGANDSQKQVDFAIGTPGITRLEEAIARKLTQGPDERADFYDRLRNRLASTVLMLRESKRNTATTITEAEAERNRIQDALAEAQAVLGALPPDVRGRVSFNPAEVMDATTERGQVSALLRLIDRADEALETVLVKEYSEKFEILMDLVKPDLRQNKSIRGRLTPGTQRQVAKVLEAINLTPSRVDAEIIGKQAEIAALEATPMPEDQAAREELAKAIGEAYVDLNILETFGNFSTLSAAEMSKAYDQLESIYVRGRTMRKVVDEARRKDIKESTLEVLKSLPRVDQGKHAERTADKGFKDAAFAWNLGISSFHQVMERLFPNSVTARDMQEKVRAADRAFTRARIEAKERFDAFIFGTWNLSGISRQRQANQILADLSALRDDWNIQIREGIGFNTEKLTEEQAIAILDGKMKTGWETDMIAMTSLRQAMIDFRMMRLKAQNEERAFRKNVIEFQRLTKRGEQGPFIASDLQALYFLQLHAQEQYRPALDKAGLTEEVIRSIEKKINPKALELGDFLRSEYDAEWDRLNPVYQRLYGLDMPKIRNYAPGMFEHMDSNKSDTPDMDAFGAAPAVNAMSAGFTKSRSHHMAKPKQVNAMAAYWSHIESTEYFIAYAELVRDARLIFRNPEVRYAIEGNYGLKASRTFSQWLDALEVDGRFRATQMIAQSEMVQRTLATQSAVGLAYNVGVLLKQITAAFGFLLEMPQKNAVRGIMAAIANPQSLAHVWKSEAVQQRILAGISPEDRRMLDAGKVSPSIIMELLDLGRLPIAYADAAFTTISGSVAYAHHLKQATDAGMSPTAAENSALAAAARVIERTAQPATTQDKSMMELSASGFSKFLMMFKSDPRQKLAIFSNAVQDMIEGKKGAKGQVAKKALYGWVLHGFANEILADVWSSMSRDGDDPDRWSWKDYLAAMLAGPASSLPFIGQGYELTVRSLIGTRAYVNSVNPADQIANFSKWKKVWDKLSDFDAEDWNLNDWLTALQQASAATAMVAGIFDPRAAILPAGVRLARDVEGMAANAFDAVTPETDNQKAMRIINEIKAEAKPVRDAKTEAKKAKAKEIMALPAEQRAAAIQKLDQETARYVIPKLKMAQMNLSEQALSRLKMEDRQIAIQKIIADMDQHEKAAYMDRLRSLGLTY